MILNHFFNRVHPDYYETVIEMEALYLGARCFHPGHMPCQPSMDHDSMPGIFHWLIRESSG